MSSIRGRIAMTMVRVIVKHWPVNDSAAMVRRARRIFGQPKLLGFRQARGITIEKVDGDVRGEWLKPANICFPDSVLLYFHGGGYVSCSSRSHRPITAALARLIGCRVFALDYRLAPEHPFPAAVEDAVKGFQWLVKSGINPEQIALVGDSAGGGLAVATLLHLRDQGAALSAGAACISPWTDLSGDFTCTNQTSCAMFFPADGMAFARIYLNGASGRSPLASPVLADLHGLPPLLIQAADSELLYDDAVRLNQKAAASGVESTLHIYKGLPHVWQMFAGVVPEANQALEEIAEFVKQKLTLKRMEPALPTVCPQ